MTSNVTVTYSSAGFGVAVALVTLGGCGMTSHASLVVERAPDVATSVKP